MIIVVDASITIARVHPHEVTPPIRSIFDMVADEGAVAPSLWELDGDLRKAAERERVLLLGI